MSVWLNGIEQTWKGSFVTDDTVWEDMHFPATTINPPGAETDPDFDFTEIGWLFAPAGIEILFLVATLPNSYAQGTSIRPHIHWEATTADAGNILWRISHRWRNEGQVAPDFTDSDCLCAAGEESDVMKQSNFAEISKPDALISSVLDIKLSRQGSDGTDTYPADARFKKFGINFRMNSVGSREEWVK